MFVHCSVRAGIRNSSKLGKCMDQHPCQVLRVLTGLTCPNDLHLGPHPHPGHGPGALFKSAQRPWIWFEQCCRWACFYLWPFCLLPGLPGWVLDLVQHSPGFGLALDDLAPGVPLQQCLVWPQLKTHHHKNHQHNQHQSQVQLASVPASSCRRGGGPEKILPEGLPSEAAEDVSGSEVRKCRRPDNQGSSSSVGEKRTCNYVCL